MSEKPNILMLVNDHQAYYRHGWDSGVRPKRPNFEKLVNEGVSFNRYYAVAPLCVPIRTTLLTGLYPHNHKNVCNDTHAPFNHDLIFDAFSKADYQNYYFGKWHAGAGIPSDYGAEGFSREGYGNTYLSREYKKYLEEMGLEMPKRKIEKVFTSEVFHRALLPLDDILPENEYSQFLKTAVKAVTCEGSIYAYPWRDSVSAMFYNKDLFEAANVEVSASIDEVWTWEEWVVNVTKVVSVAEEKQGKKVWGITF